MASKTTLLSPVDAAPPSPSPQEKDAKDIEIPNIRWNVFELMLRTY
ncbi:hypothetical protein SOVF_041410 [Spinacia oleracea]|nr:hypothetical protein SOVF_041410 [Spinacia oleracea]